MSKGSKRGSKRARSNLKVGKQKTRKTAPKKKVRATRGRAVNMQTLRRSPRVSRQENPSNLQSASLPPALVGTSSPRARRVCTKPFKDRKTALDKVLTDSAAPIRATRKQIRGLVPYDLGQTPAQTTCSLGTFSLKQQVHAEMHALDKLLEDGRVSLNDDGRIVTAKRPRALRISEFQTNVPHCGHCTIILHVLGLPLTQPSAGKYNYSGNDGYPIPDAVRNSAAFYCRLLQGTGQERVGWTHLGRLVACLMGKASVRITVGGVDPLAGEATSSTTENVAWEDFLTKRETSSESTQLLVHWLWQHVRAAITQALS